MGSHTATHGTTTRRLHILMPQTRQELRRAEESGRFPELPVHPLFRSSGNCADRGSQGNGKSRKAVERWPPGTLFDVADGRLGETRTNCQLAEGKPLLFPEFPEHRREVADEGIGLAGDRIHTPVDTGTGLIDRK